MDGREKESSFGPFEIAIVAGAVLTGWIWGAAQLAAILANGRSLHIDLEATWGAALKLPAHVQDPKAAWPPPVAVALPGPAVYWFSVVAVFFVMAAILVGVVRLFRGPHDALDRRKRLGVPTQARLARPRDLRPLLVWRTRPGRFVLGRMGRRLVATETERTGRSGRRSGSRASAGLFGPTRCGKTTRIIEGILRWQGPAVLLSLKGDLLGATSRWRRSLGDVHVFDPTGVTGQGNAMWSPLRAASSTTGAVRAARALAEAAPRQAQNVEQSDFWSQMAESLMAALLCLAANADRTFSDVVRWVLSTDIPSEGFVGQVAPLIRALKADGDPRRKASGEFADMVLGGLWRNDHRTVSSVYATARTIVWPWVDPLVAQATMANGPDLESLVSGPNSLFMCVPLADQHRLRPVIGGFLNDLVGQAFDRFVRTDQPLDPPLLLVIDEAATLRPDQLPSWTSTLAGIGVQLVTAWQSVSQVEAAYGRHAEAILTNHVTKLFFAGMSDTGGLDYVSRLIGDEHLPARLSSNEWTDERSQVATVPLVPSAVLRQMRTGDALLVHGSLPPAHLHSRPWYRNRRLLRRASSPFQRNRTRGPSFLRKRDRRHRYPSCWGHGKGGSDGEGRDR